MTKRADTAIRYVLLIAAGAVVIGMNVVAADEQLTRQSRFLLLAMLGFVAIAGWPATALAARYESRRPLRMAWGKPLQPAPSRTDPPPGVARSLPAMFPLDVGNTLWTLAATSIATIVTFVFGYALAGRADPEGVGLLAYILFAASALLVIRSVFRLVTASRALVLNDDSVVLGPSLGHVPALTVRRSKIAAIESDPPLVAFLTTEGRRFEVDSSHLRDPDLAAAIAGAWPGTDWRGWPEKPA